MASNLHDQNISLCGISNKGASFFHQTIKSLEVIFLLAMLIFLPAAMQAGLVQQGGKLVGTGAAGLAFQGQSASISGDGNTSIVGGYVDNDSTGAIWVYTRTAGVWSQQGLKLTGTGVSGHSLQGQAIALSFDGNTAIIGGNGDSSNTGAAWIFTRTGGVWSQFGNKLVGTGATDSAQQGISVCISGDGMTAMIGGYVDSSHVGASWVFALISGVWTQQGPKLVGMGAMGKAWQGQSVALSYDGNTAIVGGFGDSSHVGAAWVYTRTGGIWTQQGPKLVGTGASGPSWQGRSVAISSDGNTAIVGGSHDSTAIGAAWVFTRTGGVWTQQGNKLVGAGTVDSAWQGNSVSLSYSGDTAVVGGYGDSSNIGAGWLYTRTAGVWTQQTKLVGTGGVGEQYQGWSISLSADGNTALVGGNYDNNKAGAAWVFSTSNAGITELNAAKVALIIYPNPSNTILNIHQNSQLSTQLIITDLLGNEIYSKALTGIDNTISIATWSEGVYFYEVRGVNETARGKFVVQR